MALTRSAQAVQASATNSAGGTTTSSSFAIGYGVDLVGSVVNGATGPTIGCSMVIEVSNDSGTTWFEWFRATAPTTNSGSYKFPFSLVLGRGAGWGHYRVKFTGNTGQSVTVQCDAQSVTALF